MRTDAVKGYLDLLLLAELGRGPGHGYALIERLRDRSGGTFDFPEGTIYPRCTASSAADCSRVNGRPATRGAGGSIRFVARPRGPE